MKTKIITFANAILAKQAHAAENRGHNTRRWRRDDGTEILVNTSTRRILVAYDGKVYRDELDDEQPIAPLVDKLLGRPPEEKGRRSSPPPLHETFILDAAGAE